VHDPEFWCCMILRAFPFTARIQAVSAEFSEPICGTGAGIFGEGTRLELVDEPGAYRYPDASAGCWKRQL